MMNPRQDACFLIQKFLEVFVPFASPVVSEQASFSFFPRGNFWQLLKICFKDFLTTHACWNEDDASRLRQLPFCLSAGCLMLSSM